MTPETWVRVRERFAARLEGESPPETVETRVRRAVDELLDAHARSGDFLAAPANAGPSRDTEPEPPPEQIGAYRVLRRIGRGGMGVVYLAERADDLFEKRVAIKILDARYRSPRLQRLFETERSVLARLEHAHVTRLLDAGVLDDGRPYIVLEHVEGAPATEYIRRRNPCRDDRLALFETLCRAVEYAHRHLVVHCDLKPGNVLVTDDGTAKVLDFGIAQMLTSCNPDRRRPLTPGYAGPELAAGEAASTATDVYSLGVVLEDFLTVGTDRPVPRALRTVVAKATAHDRDERYDSVAELRREVRRYRSRRPVAAVGRAPLYRLGLLLRRQWLVTAVIVLALVVLIPTAWQVWSQREQLRREERRLSSLADYLTGVFELSDWAVGRGGSVTALELLDAHSARGLSGFEDSPALAGELEGTLGRLYLALGAAEPALEHLDRAARRREREGLPPDDDLDSARAAALVALGRYEPGETLARRVIDAETAAGRAGHELFESYAARVAALLALQRPDEALETARTGVAAAEVAGPRHAAVAAPVRARLIEAELIAGLTEEATATARRALATLPAEGVPPHARSELEGLLARALLRRGEGAEAERLLRSAVGRYEAVYGRFHPDLRSVINDLAGLYYRQGRWQESEDQFRKGLALARELLPADHSELYVHLNNLAEHLLLAGKYDESLELLDEMTAFGEAWEPADPRRVMTLFLLSLTHHCRDDLAASQTFGRQALELLQGDPPGIPTAVPQMLRIVIALNHVELGELDTADALLRGMETEWAAEHGAEYSRIGQVRVGRARVAQQRGDLTAARRLYDSALQVLEAAYPEDDSYLLADALKHRATLAELEGRSDEARADAGRSAEIYTKVLPAGHPDRPVG